MTTASTGERFFAPTAPTPALHTRDSIALRRLAEWFRGENLDMFSLGTMTRSVWNLGLSFDKSIEFHSKLIDLLEILHRADAEPTDYNEPVNTLIARITGDDTLTRIRPTSILAGVACALLHACFFAIILAS